MTLKKDKREKVVKTPQKPKENLGKVRKKRITLTTNPVEEKKKNQI